MDYVAAAPYGLLGVFLVVGGALLYAAESMAGVPLYEAGSASDPAALARVLGASLSAFGVSTLAFAALHALDRADVVVVASYGVVVLCTAFLTAWRVRPYE
jgi:hypothetical protein